MIEVDACVFRRGLRLYLDERRLAMPLNRIQNQYRAIFITY